MAKPKVLTITDERYINFKSQVALDYFNYLESLSLEKFNKLISYEWNSILLLFGKGDKEMEEKRKVILLKMEDKKCKQKNLS